MVLVQDRVSGLLWYQVNVGLYGLCIDYELLLLHGLVIYSLIKDAIELN